MRADSQQQGHHRKQQKGDVNLADLGDHQLQQLDISIHVLAIVRVVSVLMAMVAIQVHMHRKWRLLPIKTKMPMGAQQVAQQPEQERHKSKWVKGSAHGNRRWKMLVKLNQVGPPCLGCGAPRLASAPKWS